MLLDPPCADPLYRRSVRVSMGHVLRVPFAVLPGPWPAALVTVARARASSCWRMTPAAAAVDLRDVAAADRAGPCCSAPKGPGLTAGALAAADQRVRIPMADGVDSLNVATAAAAFALRSAYALIDFPAGRPAPAPAP